MTITLTAVEIGYLKELAAAGKHGRTITAPTPRKGVKRLVAAGYVVGRAISVDAAFYMITDLGHQALRMSAADEN